MKNLWLLLFVLLMLPLFAQARVYRKGTIIRMSTVKCTGFEHKGVADVIAGSFPNEEESCREFTLKDDKVVYHIRTRKDQLLPLGEEVDFRLSRKELIIKQEDSTEESRFRVVSMKLIGEADEEDQKALKMYANHCVDSDGNLTPCNP